MRQRPPPVLTRVLPEHLKKEGLNPRVTPVGMSSVAAPSKVMAARPCEKLVRIRRPAPSATVVTPEPNDDSSVTLTKPWRISSSP